MNNTCTKVRSLSWIFFNHGQLSRLIITFFCQCTVQPWCRSLLWGSFTETLWCLVCGNKLCQLTDIKNIRITRLFVCAPFNWSIYKDLWSPVWTNLQIIMVTHLPQFTGIFNPLVVLQIEDLRPACTNNTSIFCWSLKVVCLCFLYCCSGRSSWGARGARPPLLLD